MAVSFSPCMALYRESELHRSFAQCAYCLLLDPTTTATSSFHSLGKKELPQNYHRRTVNKLNNEESKLAIRKC